MSCSRRRKCHGRSLEICSENHSNSNMNRVRFARNGEQLVPIGTPISCRYMLSPTFTYKCSSRYLIHFMILSLVTNFVRSESTRLAEARFQGAGERPQFCTSRTFSSPYGWAVCLAYSNTRSVYAFILECNTSRSSCCCTSFGSAAGSEMG